VVEEFEADLPDQPTVAAEIRAILFRDLDLFWERRDFMRVSVSQGTIDEEIGHTISTNLNDQRVRSMLEKLRRHQASGGIRPETDVEAIAYTLSALGFSIGFVLQSSFGKDRDLARRIMTGAAQALSDGISPTPGEEQTR